MNKLIRAYSIRFDNGIPYVFDNFAEVVEVLRDGLEGFDTLPLEAGCNVIITVGPIPKGELQRARALPPVIEDLLKKMS